MNLHLGLSNTALQESLLPGSQASHKNRLGATAGGYTGTIRGGIEESENLDQTSAGMLFKYRTADIRIIMHTIATTSASIFRTPGKTSG